MVSVATRDCGVERRESKEVLLDETAKGIQLQNDFLKLSGEERGKLLRELPIFEHVSLLVNLHVHGSIKELSRNNVD